MTELPPNSPEGEQGVLSCCLLDPNRIDECQAKFKAGPKVFYTVANRTIYEALCEMRSTLEIIEVATLISKLRDSNRLTDAGGIEYIAALPDKSPSAENIAYYIAMVWEKYQLALIVRSCQKAIRLAMECNSDSETLIGKLQNGFYDLHTSEADTSDGKACATGLADDLERRNQLFKAGKHSGIITGFKHLDGLTDGLQLRELSIVAARPSIGKTALGISVLDYVCLTDSVPCLFITMEMSRDALMRRLFCAHSSVPMNAAKFGEFTDSQWKSYTNFSASILPKHPIFIHDGVKGMNIDQVSAVVRRFSRMHGIKLVIGDYIQRVKAVGRHEKRTYEVGEVSTALKALADDTNTAQLWLCRVNRESEKNKKDPKAPDSPPKLSHLSDSGQIEYDADLIGLLHRDKFGSKPNEATLAVAKQRDGELGMVHLNFSGTYCRFENPTQQTPTNYDTD